MSYPSSWQFSLIWSGRERLGPGESPNWGSDIILVIVLSNWESWLMTCVLFRVWLCSCCCRSHCRTRVTMSQSQVIMTQESGETGSNGSPASHESMWTGGSCESWLILCHYLQESSAPNSIFLSEDSARRANLSLNTCAVNLATSSKCLFSSSLTL